MNTLVSSPLEVDWSFYGTRRFKRQRILVVDYQGGVLKLHISCLVQAGYQVTTAANSSSALVRARAAMPSLIVINLSSQRTLGLEVCRKLKADNLTRHIPVIFLASDSTAEERIQGLELQADDYVTQPFSPREVLLRIRNSLQRAEPSRPNEVKMSLDDLVLDPVRHEVTINAAPVYLSLIEFRLLNFFMERCGTVLDRETLLNEVWGRPYLSITRTVDTHVRRLRRKLGAWSRHLEAVRGTGYRLNENVPAFPTRPERVPSKSVPYFLDRLEKGQTLLSVGEKRRFGSRRMDTPTLVGAGRD